VASAKVAQTGMNFVFIMVLSFLVFCYLTVFHPYNERAGTFRTEILDIIRRTTGGESSYGGDRRCANSVLPTSRRRSVPQIPLPARCRQHSAVHGESPRL